MRFIDSAGPSRKQITSDTEIRVTLEVPAWLKFVSVGAIESTGSKACALETLQPCVVPQHSRR